MRIRRLIGAACACSALLTVSCAQAENPATATTSNDTLIPLVVLDSSGAVAAWTTVDDPVMGGRSSSRIAFSDGGLVFSGEISLENNGGFASARSPEDAGIGDRAAGAVSLRVHARGDGKTYLMKVGIAGQAWSYVQRFTTEATVAGIYDLPVDRFEPVGKRLDPAPDAPATLDPAGIDQVAIYILDKQQGRFELAVTAIDARM